SSVWRPPVSALVPYTTLFRAGRRGRRLRLGLGGRGSRARRRFVVHDLADGLGGRERLRGLALERVLHVVRPDLGRERRTVDLLLPTRPEHLQELAVLDRLVV